MTVPRVKPGNWSLNDRLLRSEAIQLDKNQTYLLDSVPGNFDTIESQLTVDSTGSLIFASGSTLTIEDVATIETSTYLDGYMGIEAQMLGEDRIDPSKFTAVPPPIINCPLRFGYTNITIPSTGTYTIPPIDGYENAMHIQLLGTIYTDVTVVLPNRIGYRKFIEGAFSAPYNNVVTLSVGGAGDTVTLRAGSNTFVFCDGNSLKEIANTGYTKLVDKGILKTISSSDFYPAPNALIADMPPNMSGYYVLNSIGGSGAIINGATSTVIPGEIGFANLPFTNYNVNGKIVFLDGRAGDKFEIMLSCGVQRQVLATNIMSWIAPYIVYGDGYVYKGNQYMAPWIPQYKICPECLIPAFVGEYNQSSGKTIFTAPYNGTYEFRACMYYSIPAPDVYINNTFPTVAYSPLVLSVKQYRFLPQNLIII